MKPHSSAPGLGPSVQSKRLATWQATHQQLLREDAGYRKRFHAYLITLFGLACLLLPFYLPLFGIRLFGAKLDLSIILAVAAVAVGLSVRQLHFQRQAIRRHLQSKGDT